jgi:flagellar hook-length control protein FliK
MLGAEGVKQLQSQEPQIFQQPVTQPQVSENFAPDSAVLNMQVAQVLGLASLETGRYSQEITDAIEWAKANGAKSMDDILYEIRYLSNRLGNNPNEKKIKTISRFIFLSGERNRLNTEIERLQTL